MGCGCRGGWLGCEGKGKRETQKDALRRAQRYDEMWVGDASPIRLRRMALYEYVLVD